jgi:hypothetical protein
LEKDLNKEYVSAEELAESISNALQRYKKQDKKMEISTKLKIDVDTSELKAAEILVDRLSEKYEKLNKQINSINTKANIKEIELKICEKIISILNEKVFTTDNPQKIKTLTETLIDLKQLHPFED